MDSLGVDQPREKYLNQASITALYLSSALVTLVLSVVLIQVWPGGEPAEGSSSSQFMLWSIRLSGDQRLLLVSMLSGALGSLVHCIRSMYWYAGNRRLRASWLYMYASLPIIGSLVALITYFLLRAGFTDSAASSAGVNPYGVASIGALGGMFSPQAVGKLRKVFEAILVPSETGSDAVSSPEIYSFTPSEGPVGTLVTIRGVGLASTAAVRFGNAMAIAQEARDTEVNTVVPEGATSAQPVIITLTAAIGSPYVFKLVKT